MWKHVGGVESKFHDSFQWFAQLFFTVVCVVEGVLIYFVRRDGALVEIVCTCSDEIRYAVACDGCYFWLFLLQAFGEFDVRCFCFVHFWKL